MEEAIYTTGRRKMEGNVDAVNIEIEKIDLFMKINGRERNGGSRLYAVMGIKGLQKTSSLTSIYM